jgi:hypothetical protein
LQHQPLKAKAMIRQECQWYRAFHGFGQAKFPDGGLVLGSSQFTLLHAPAASKNDTRF